MAQQTVMQLFHKWIDCNQSLKVSVNGEKSKRNAWKPLVRNPFLSWVSVFSGIVDLDSPFIPFSLELAIMPLSGVWDNNLSQPEGHKATNEEILNHRPLCKD